MNTNSLQQHVNEPTRKNNILDLVMATTDLSINDLEVTDEIDDPQMINFTLEVQDPNTWIQPSFYSILYDRTKAVDFVYLDFQKAFDKVPHERLMAEVEAHGIRGNYSLWIRNWLTGRTQRVVIHDQASDLMLITLGVPQSSVLGLRLFIMYINDLDVGIISKINKFAYDTKLCHRTFTERDKVTIQSHPNSLLHWTEIWQMSFNIDKCSVMQVGANNRHFQRTMYDKSIETVHQ
ncbi:Reverse transcriptase domain [Trinorchestia longiramus]|nr:Reverse transcriptase domain [Trinorchestia longiramus]